MTFDTEPTQVSGVRVRDPRAERDAVDALVGGTARATEAPVAPVSPIAPQRPAVPAATRNGLTQRVPGANLGDFARVPVQPRAEDPLPARDPEAERGALEAFTDGLARANPPEPTTGDRR
jgi:hypothetical protein